MAKYERHFEGDFENFVKYVEDSVVRGSRSAHLEEAVDTTMKDVKVAVRIFERYSAFSSSRVSLNVTIVSNDGLIYVLAIPSGGSQAMFFKIDTVGEENFLYKFSQSIDEYISSL